MQDFNFDWWKALAERDPAAFYVARERMLNELVNATPGHEQTLRALQDKVDHVRALCVSPLVSSQALAILMLEHLATLRAGCDRLATEMQNMQQMQDATPRDPSH